MAALQWSALRLPQFFYIPVGILYHLFSSLQGPATSASIPITERLSTANKWNCV